MKGIPLPSKGKGLKSQNQGIATSGCLILLILLVGLGYVGVKVGQAFWNYYQVREQLRGALIWAVAGQVKGDKEIIERAISNASGAGVQLSPRNVRLRQTPETLTITASWSEELEFPFFTFPLNLEVNLAEIKRWGRGGLVVK